MENNILAEEGDVAEDYACIECFPIQKIFIPLYLEIAIAAPLTPHTPRDSLKCLPRHPHLEIVNISIK